MAEFTKVRLFYFVGLLRAKYNFKSNTFESSIFLYLNSWLALLAKLWFTLKFFVSSKFVKHSIVQLYIGSLFNYLSYDQKYFMGFIGLAGASWGLALHLTFNHLNAKNDFRRFKFWMKISHELPVKSEQDYEVFGWTKEKNKRFWQAEKRLNSLWIKVSSYFILLSCVVFSGQLFLVPFDVNITTYILVQTVHVLHSSYSLIVYMHSFFTINLFYVSVMHWTSKRLAHISKKVERLNEPKARTVISAKRINYKIARLIRDCNRVHFDLIELNNFFCFFTGFNLIHFAAVGILAIFIALSVNWILKLMILSVVAVLYCLIIAVPFIFANSVSIEVRIVWSDFLFEDQPLLLF